MIASGLPGCCSHCCPHRRPQICHAKSVVVLIFFVSILASACGTLVYPPLNDLSCRDQQCPEYFYCEPIFKTCYPCSGYLPTKAYSKSCEIWPVLQQSETVYGMLKARPDLTPSCNASVLDDNDLVSATCHNPCEKIGRTVYCFAGTACNATCNLTAYVWSGSCTCQLVEKSRFSCAWSTPPPACAAAVGALTTTAAVPPVPPRTEAAVTSSAAVTPPSEAAAATVQRPEAGSSAAVVSACVAGAGTAVFGITVLTAVLLLRRSKRRRAAKAIVSGVKEHPGHDTTIEGMVPPNEPPITDQGRPSSAQTAAPIVIVNHVTNNTNVAVMSPLQHLTVSNGGVVGPGLVQRQQRCGPQAAALRQAGKPCRCQDASVTADSLTAHDDGCDDVTGSDVDSGCRQPLLATSGSPCCDDRCLQAATSTKHEPLPRLGNDARSDVISLPHADVTGSSWCSDPAAETVAAAAVHDGPRMEPPPEDFVDACGYAHDYEPKDPCLVEGHDDWCADTDDEDGGTCSVVTASEQEVCDSAYCSTGSGDSGGAVGVPAELHYPGLVTVKAACVKYCEVLTEASTSRTPPSIASAADGSGVCGASGASGAVHLELGYVDVLRVAASAEESPTTQLG